MDKESLRKWARDKRKELDIYSLSVSLTEKLIKSEAYQQAKNIMLYYPLKTEINLLSVLKDETKRFFLPKIEGKNLICCSHKEGEELCVSCFKTLEPKTEPTPKSYIDLAIIPALAVDEHNFRLGYGGGFYDRFLKDFQGKTLVCIPLDLIVKTICPQEFDIPVDLIISE